MNSKQRPAIFIATVLISLLVLFHAPWSGYDTTYMQKSNPTAEQVKAGEKSGFVPIHILTPTPLSASEWKTNEPLGKWFGSPWNILGSIFLVVCVTWVWCFLYRTIPSKGE